MSHVREVEWNVPEDVDKELSGQTIKTKYWELPLESIGEWRPRTAYIDYRYFIGPSIAKREHGFSLNQDLVAALHGPRGATKTMTLSYLQAKKMRMGQPDWANYPISFYVIEPACLDHCQKRLRTPWVCGEGCPDGYFTYYENMPLDLDKFYRFSKQIRGGNVGITEFQYYVESRTSGKKQNRLATYQIMQIRKTALSFWYDVQNPEWVDKRFAWSDDTVIEVQDVAMMNYDYESIGHDLQHGERSLWTLEDRSGVLTGERGTVFPDLEFHGWPFRNIYPTHFIVDAYEAMNSYKEENTLKAEREDKEARLANTINMVLNSFANNGTFVVSNAEICKRARELAHVDVTPSEVGQFLSENGVTGKLHRRKMEYDFSSLIQSENEALET